MSAHVYDDVARFGAGDHPQLVEASFCCQLCLRAPSLVFIEEDADAEDGCARCYCDVCRAHTRVALNPEQLVRLHLAPRCDAQIYILAETDA
jgi:hypothetical protein